MRLKIALLSVVFAFCLWMAQPVRAGETAKQAPADAAAKAEGAKDLENTLYLDLKDGRVTIELRPDLAPKHVARIKELARQNFYNGVKWHRVIDGFMAQTGDPTGTGAGGSGQKLQAEFSKETHVRGTVSMARASDPNSADSQWFICFAPAAHLDGKYTVWGKVTDGMELVDKIKRGDSYSGKVDEPDVIVKLQVAADAEKDAAQTGGEAPKDDKPAGEVMKEEPKEPSPVKEAPKGDAGASGEVKEPETKAAETKAPATEVKAQDSEKTEAPAEKKSETPVETGEAGEGEKE